MPELVVPILVFAVYVVLMRWVLPKLGMPA